MLTKKEVMKVLEKVMDPEINISIVALGLIYGIDINGSNAKIRMTLTTPHCPMGALIVEDVRNAAKKIKGIKNVEIELVFDPPWSPERLSKDVRKKLGFK